METLKIPTMLKIREAAARTGLPYYHILKLCKADQVSHIRTGRTYYVNMDKLVEYLNNPGRAAGGDA